jgi:hypothetical protein
MAIPAYSPATAAQFNNYPPAGYMPAGYGPNPGGEIAMGKHWGDPTTFMPFTKTMILGTYDGHFIFDEPMITLDYLKATNAVSTPFPQPQFFEHTGKYYPTVYNIRTESSSGKKYITLSDFVLR